MQSSIRAGPSGVRSWRTSDVLGNTGWWVFVLSAGDGRAFGASRLLLASLQLVKALPFGELLASVGSSTVRVPYAEGISVLGQRWLKGGHEVKGQLGGKGLREKSG